MRPVASGNAAESSGPAGTAAPCRSRIPIEVRRRGPRRPRSSPHRPLTIAWACAPLAESSAVQPSSPASRTAAPTRIDP